MFKRVSKFISLTLVFSLIMSMFITGAYAEVTTLGKFDDYLTASKKSVGSEESYQVVSASENSKIYGDVTIVKYPVGTVIKLKDSYRYYITLRSLDESLKPGEPGKWAPLISEYTITDDHIIWLFYITNYKDNSVKLIYVQGAPNPAGSEDGNDDNLVQAKPGVDPKEEIPRLFEDVPVDAWYSKSVTFCYRLNVMNGISETKFGPDNNLTRAMVWVMLARMDGVSNIGGKTWYEGAQNWAKKNGISDGTYPNKEVTKEQLATMAYKFFLYKKLPWYSYNEVNTSYGLDNTIPTFSEYTDRDEISSYALKAMKWAVDAGLMNFGDTPADKLEPTKVANRAQVAYFIASINDIWDGYLVVG